MYSNSNPILEVSNLKVSFYLPDQVITAVDGFNIYLKEAETVVLAGESGSGKTISVLSLVKILPPNSRIIEGKVMFGGNNLLKMDETQLIKIRGKSIAYIFQEPASYLNPLFTVGEQIMESLRLHQGKKNNEAFNESLKLLTRVKIKDAERVMLDYPHQLSGGMNQRVFIAMSLACRPKILIADEPTTSLDVTVEAEILKLLQELKEEFGFSLLFITHNLSIAKRIAERVYIMYKGKIVEEAVKDAIFSSPSHHHTKELIAAYELIGKLP